MDSHWRRLNRAFDHIQTLDNAICRWLNSDAYRVVKEHDAEAGRTAFVARFDDLPTEWLDLVGEAVHNMRSALDHLALSLNTKGYAETNGGGALPVAEEAKSSFPIYGNTNQRGEAIDGENAFRSATSYRNMPDGAKDLIERLQPYNRGQHFTDDPLWAIHELSRIDKHRIDLGVTAVSPRQSIGPMVFDKVADAQIGIGGPVYNGKELSYWVVPEGAKEPNPDLYFARGVAFGEGTPLSNQPLVASLRGIRNHIRYRVAFPLDRFL